MAAITADKVDVVLGADINAYLKNLNTAGTAFDALVSKAEKDAAEAGVAFSSLGDKAKAGLGQVPVAAAAANKALAGVRLNSANVAAQFNDIAVQLAAGQSPFQIALQQGTQLSQALGSARGLTGVVAALGEGLAAMINPVSILTIATIALGGAAIQWLSKSNDDLAAVNDRIKKQKEFIDNLPSAYNAAKEAATQYRNAAAPPREEVLGNTADQRAAALADETRQLQQLAHLAQSSNIAANIGVTKEELDLMLSGNAELGNQVKNLQDISHAAQAANPDLNAVVLQLQDFIRSNPDQVLRGIAQGMLDAAKNARDFATNAGAAKAVLDSFPKDINVQVHLNLQEQAFSSAFEKLKGLEQGKTFDNPFDAARDEAKKTADAASKNAISYAQLVGVASEYKNVLDGINAAEKQANDKKTAGDALQASKRQADDLTRQRQAVVDLVDALEFQRNELGKTDEQQAVDNNLRKAGTVATADQRAVIETTTKAIYEQQEAQKRNRQELQDFLDLGKTGLQTFLSDLESGKGLLVAFGDALAGIGGQLQSGGLSSLFASDGPLANLLGGLGGGGAGSDLGVLTPNMRANGGPVNRGQSYIVGEHQPELFTPDSPGMITPLSKLGGTGSGPVFAPVINMPGATAEAVARVETTLRQLQSEFVPRVRDQVKGFKRSWA